MEAVHGPKGIRATIAVASLPISVLITSALTLVVPPLAARSPAPVSQEQIRGAPFRQGSIAGTVRDGAGNPVAGAIVTAFLRRTMGLLPILIHHDAVALGRRTAPVDAQGQFEIAGLPPGEYLVCACGRDPIDKSLLAFLDRGWSAGTSMTQRLGDSVSVFAPTFHPGSTSASGAVPVMLDKPDDSRTGIDITVRAVVGLRVSGQITGGGANAADRLTLRLFPQNDLPEAAVVSGFVPSTVSPGGAFEFAGVPSGRYSLEVYTKDGKGQPTEGPWASVLVIVGAQDVAGLVVPLGSGTTIAGRVEFSGVAARPDANALMKGVVFLMPLAWTPRVIIRDRQLQAMNTNPSVGHLASLQRDGSFRIEGVPPGRYAVMGFFAPAWPTIEAVRTSAGIGRNAPRLREVLVFPVDPSTWSEPSLRRFRKARVTGSGTFRAEVPAGDYFIVQLPADPLDGQLNESPDVYMSPERFKAWSQRATRVSLRPGETTKVELKR